MNNGNIESFQRVQQGRDVGRRRKREASSLGLRPFSSPSRKFSLSKEKVLIICSTRPQNAVSFLSREKKRRRRRQVIG